MILLQAAAFTKMCWICLLNSTFRVGNEEAAIILKERKKFPDMVPTLWIEVEDVRAKYAALQGRNIRFLSEPFRIRTGWAVEFVDPSGNRLGLVDYQM